MSEADTTKAALTYALAWTVSAAVGVAIAGYGAVQWLLPAYVRLGEGAPPSALVNAVAPGLALLFLGLLLWKMASTLAYYRTLGPTVAADTAERLNTEAMKSDILSVIDERLADMKGDTQRTRRIVERESSEDAADDFEFPGNR